MMSIYYLNNFDDYGSPDPIDMLGIDRHYVGTRKVDKARKARDRAHNKMARVSRRKNRT